MRRSLPKKIFISLDEVQAQNKTMERESVKETQVHNENGAEVKETEGKQTQNGRGAKAFSKVNGYFTKSLDKIQLQIMGRAH